MPHLFTRLEICIYIYCTRLVIPTDFRFAADFERQLSRCAILRWVIWNYKTRSYALGSIINRGHRRRAVIASWLIAARRRNRAHMSTEPLKAAADARLAAEPAAEQEERVSTTNRRQEPAESQARYLRGKPAEARPTREQSEPSSRRVFHAPNSRATGARRTAVPPLTHAEVSSASAEEVAGRES